MFRVLYLKYTSLNFLNDFFSKQPYLLKTVFLQTKKSLSFILTVVHMEYDTVAKFLLTAVSFMCKFSMFSFNFS